MSIYLRKTKINIILYKVYKFFLNSQNVNQKINPLEFFEHAKMQMHLLKMFYYTKHDIPYSNSTLLVSSRFRMASSVSVPRPLNLRSY